MPATTWAGVEPGITSCVVRAVDQDGLESADSARVFPAWDTDPDPEPDAPGAPTDVRIVVNELPPSTGPPGDGVVAEVVGTPQLVSGSSSHADGVNTIALQFDTAPTVGNVVMLMMRVDSPFVDIQDAVAIDDSADNTWTLLVARGRGATQSTRRRVHIWAAEVEATDDPLDLVITMPGDQSWQTGDIRGALLEISGANLADLVAGTWSDSGDSASSFPLTLTDVGEGLRLAALSAEFSDVKSVSSGWTGIGGGSAAGDFMGAHSPDQGSVTFSGSIASPTWAVIAVEINSAAAGGTTVEASLSTPAAALAGFDSRVIARGGVTAAASAGETHGASSTIRAAITAGATAQEVAGGVASMAAQLAAAAHAGAEATARATMAATITESAGAGEAVSRQGAVLDQMVAAAEADALLSAYLQAVAALAAGVEAGDAWAARLTAAATLSGAADAGAEFSEDSVALIAEQSDAGAQFAAAVHALAEQLEGATAGAAMAGVVSTLAAFSSASSAGAVFESAMRHADALQAGAEAGAAFSGITGELTGLLLESVSAAMVVSSAHQARAAWSATAYAGASFVASGDVSALIGALAFVVAAEQRVFTVPEETRTFIVS